MISKSAKLLLCLKPITVFMAAGSKSLPPPPPPPPSEEGADAGEPPKPGEIHTVECPNCGADLKYDAGLQGFECEYCGSHIDIEPEPTRPAKEKDLFAAPKHHGWDTKLDTVKCSECGSTIAAAGVHSGECPFCGSHFVKKQPQRKDIITPENMVPFKIDKDNAEGKFDNWIGKGWFRPNDLKKLKELENIRGVYMPFWTYDCNAYSNWTADAGYYYYVTVSYTAYENGKRVRRTRQERRIRWVPASGSRRGFYDDVLVLASKGLDRGLVEKVYPYQLNELVPFKPDYIVGWLAEEYSVDVHHGWDIAQGKVRSSERSKCSSMVPGDTQRNLHVNTNLANMTYKHILLPLWIASYKYKTKIYHFMVNGQTGKIEGQKPWSWIKISLAIAACCFLCGAVVAGFLILSNLGYI